MDLSINPNTRWTSIFVDHLVQAGLRTVCIAPGSRSTPITLAFAQHPDVQIYTHLDERSAGFFALGLAMAPQAGRPQPVALVCTSGTAAANFHPAIIEAFYAHIPLLVLTADRPPELRESGANQTIDQVKMYGDHVLWAVDAPVPQPNAPDVVVRHIQTLAARAMATANGLVMGPVHINFPFRKPLEPEGVLEAGETQETSKTDARPTPYTLFSRGRMVPDEYQVEQIGKRLQSHPQGFIICGPDPFAHAYEKEVLQLAYATGYPILADPLSNLRLGKIGSEGMVLGAYHTWLPLLGRLLPPAEAIIRFGAVPTSSELSHYLDSLDPALHIHVREDGRWADDLHRTQTHIQADPAAFCNALSAYLSPGASHAQPDWAKQIQLVESAVWKALDQAIAQAPLFDGSAVSRLIAALPEDTILFAGNSMPVRHIDTYAQPATRNVSIFGNRGASGIDGNVSTALGLAAGSGRHVVALLGDITLYHDMNGLLAASRHGLTNCTFVVLNNNGGSIFHRLPIARFEPPFTDLFLMPHGLTFAHAAALYGLDYRSVQNADAYGESLSWALSNPDRRQTARILEVETDSAADYQQQTSIRQAVQNNLLKMVGSNTVILQTPDTELATGEIHS